jgi:hypothetical protein
MKTLISGAAVALALVAGTSTAAQAQHSSVEFARKAALGGCAHNHRTHVLTCVIGTYKYHRQVRRRGHWRTIPIWGVVVSGQRCRKSGCWGRTAEGRLWTGHQPGRPVPGGRPVPRGGLPTNPCLASQVCVNPFFWLKPVADGEQHLIDKAVKPCDNGTIDGFTKAMGGNLLARFMLESGLIADGTFAAKFAAPEAVGFITVGDCASHVWQRGVNDVDSWISHIR